MRPTLAFAAILLAAFAPTIVASGPLVVEGTIGAPDTPFALMRLDRWRFDVVAGDVISATLAWDDPGASLALEVVPPQLSCSNEECVTTIATFAECTSVENTPFPTTSRREITVASTANSLASVFVSSEFASGPVAYILTIAVNGEAPEIDFFTNEGSTTPHRQHVCRAEDKL